MLTIYNDDENEYQQVEEPDASFNYTYADYMKWKFEERLELIRGKIMKMGAPTTLHQKVAMKLQYEIYGYLRGKACFPFMAPFDVRLPVKNRKKDYQITTVVQPDLGVVCDQSKIDTRGCCGAPDLIIEILSPGNSKRDVRIKYDLYEEAGVKEYWIIHPSDETVAVFLLNDIQKFDGARMYAEGDVLNSTAVTGFTINVTEIFTN
ncbi:MAG TPA: Uma2 family endonuclease [Chitinophagaceae bacterium]|nr:Uma2 family endonuclease [Chitinophagaceae bacterium]